MDTRRRVKRFNIVVGVLCLALSATSALAQTAAKPNIVIIWGDGDYHR